MKILFDYQILTSQKYGGVSRYHCEIKKQFDKVKGVKCDVPVLFSKNIYFEEAFGIKRIEKYASGVSRFIRRANQIYTKLMCSKGKYDIIHPTWYDPYLISSCSKSKLVITIHDMIYEIYPGLFSAEMIENRKKYILAADKIIAVSQNTKKDILRFYPEVDQAKIEVVYESATVAKRTDSIMNIPENYILYVGSRFAYKNFDTFVDAMAKILKKYPEINVLCAGGGAFNADECELLKKFGVEDQFKQLWMTDEQLNFAYQNAICFVYPSKYEGFGLPILEAMINMCPCVISNASCFPEVGEDSALYFDPSSSEDMANTVEKFCNDSQLRTAFIERGRLQAKKFSWEITATQILQIYTEVINASERQKNESK